MSSTALALYLVLWCALSFLLELATTAIYVVTLLFLRSIWPPIIDLIRFWRKHA